MSIEVEEKNGELELSVSNGIELEENTDTDTETARTVYKEARCVLDHQIKLLDDIDDKAARTVRITVLLVGAILGAASFEDSTGVSLASSYMMLGTGYLILSIALGMKTYNVSKPYLGPNAHDLQSLLQDTSGEDDMLTFLVEDGFTDWISETEFLNRINGWYLDLTQVSLVVGILSLAMGLLDQLLTQDQAPTLKPVLTTLESPLLIGLPLLLLVILTLITIGYSIYHAYTDQ